MKNGRTTMIKRFFALALAFAVSVSILTVPVQETYAAGGKVKTVAVTNLPAKQLTLKKGKTFALKSKVTVTGKASKKVTYKTSNKKIATVNAKGKITAKKKGTAKIYVISKADKKKKMHDHSDSRNAGYQGKAEQDQVYDDNWKKADLKGNGYTEESQQQGSRMEVIQ